MKLNSHTLDDFIEDVAVPTYDRSEVKVGLPT